MRVYDAQVMFYARVEWRCEEARDISIRLLPPLTINGTSHGERRAASCHAMPRHSR